MRLSIHSSFGPARVGDDPRRELVVDRAEVACVLLDEQAVADERHGRAFRLVAELDREGIHRDRAEHASPRAGHEDFRPGEPTAKAVRVPHWDEPDPRLAPGDEAPPVPGAATDGERLRLRDVAPPGEHRPEAVLRRIATEGREAVERDPAAHRIE